MGCYQPSHVHGEVKILSGSFVVHVYRCAGHVDWRLPQMPLWVLAVIVNRCVMAFHIEIILNCCEAVWRF
jgi:hypothetical protein